MKSIVLCAPGTNCDIETVTALNYVGFDTTRAHINQLIRKEIKLPEYHLLVIPGGFSFGDYISAGKIFTVEIFYKLNEQLHEFINKPNRVILGICNGFQVLVKLGLLPEVNFVQQVTLTDNISQKFECRWVYLKVNKKNCSLITKLPEIVEFPVAHAEGRFFASEDVLDKIEKNEQILFQYSTKNGDTNCGYPLNPNGSEKNIAGITDPSGKIIGLMPHPERFIEKVQYPNYRFNNKITVPYGYLFFKFIKEMVK